MMRADLLYYYERELRFLRQQVQAFAAEHPALAGQLTPNPDRFEDPHVERLIEACSMLAARVQMRLDDEYPELTGALLSTAFPSYMQMLPSATIVQLTGDPDRADATTGQNIPRHTILQHRQNRHVRFRTAYPVTLWPVEIAKLELVPLRDELHFHPRRSRAALRIRLRTLAGQSLADFSFRSLRLFLDGESRTTHGLYELLIGDPLGVLIGPPDFRASQEDVRAGGFVPAEGIQPVGFHKDDGLYEATGASYLPLRLIQEYFSFPDKFMFVDLHGLHPACFAKCGEEADVLVLLERMPTRLTLPLGPAHLKLGCTPAVNLFPHYAVPIELSHRVTEYPIRADMPDIAECDVHSVLSVNYTDPATGADIRIPPLYAAAAERSTDASAIFWSLSRSGSMPVADSETVARITIVDRDGQFLREPPVRFLHVLTLCCNGDLPRRLPPDGARGDFQLEGFPGIRSVVRLREPSVRMWPPGHRQRHWRLIALLRLNLVSLLGHRGISSEDRDDAAARAAGVLQELLELLDFTGTPTNQMRRHGLVGVDTAQITRRILVSSPSGFEQADAGDATTHAGQRRLLCRGLGVTLALDSACYEGSSALLLSAVMDRFFALMAPVNSFTETIVRLHPQQGVYKRWPARSGERPLI